MVGGVLNSPHLSGRAADYWGSDLNKVLAEVRQLPGHQKSFIHNAGSGSHVHAEGNWQVPYFGKRGTAGLRKQ